MLLLELQFCSWVDWRGRVGCVCGASRLGSGMRINRAFYFYNVNQNSE